jgi:hypothetical protein
MDIALSILLRDMARDRLMRTISEHEACAAARKQETLSLLFGSGNLKVQLERQRLPFGNPGDPDTNVHNIHNVHSISNRLELSRVNKIPPHGAPAYVLVDVDIIELGPLQSLQDCISPFRACLFTSVISLFRANI